MNEVFSRLKTIWENLDCLFHFILSCCAGQRWSKQIHNVEFYLLYDLCCRALGKFRKTTRCKNWKSSLFRIFICEKFLLTATRQPIFCGQLEPPYSTGAPARPCPPYIGAGPYCSGHIGPEDPSNKKNNHHFFSSKIVGNCKTIPKM